MVITRCSSSGWRPGCAAGLPMVKVPGWIAASAMPVRGSIMMAAGPGARMRSIKIATAAMLSTTTATGWARLTIRRTVLLLRGFRLGARGRLYACVDWRRADERRVLLHGRKSGHVPSASERLDQGHRRRKTPRSSYCMAGRVATFHPPPSALIKVTVTERRRDRLTGWPEERPRSIRLRAP